MSWLPYRRVIEQFDYRSLYNWLQWTDRDRDRSSVLWYVTTCKVCLKSLNTHLSWQIL